ncbi:DUF308 domain-containing protein [Bradyrhizobium sp. dw_411]|uniref:DUF308 domain-containing protein n=1 Tax=Bradyrhizobium sp. dw_411 TaxID=2720082 RepID=UPI001BCB91DE|nr:DUF308 domain-containing protein [Bradyrhizobium sp. dw_411]
MMIVMLVAGIGCVLAGLLAIGFGIPVQEFSFGNTLILSGAVTACTGLIILGLWVVVGELRNIAQRLGAGVAPNLAAPRNPAPEISSFPFNRDQAAPEDAGHAEANVPSAAPSPAPWREEAAARTRSEVSPPAPEPAEAEALAPKPRRNLLFSSSSRKERERAQSRTVDPALSEFLPAPAVAPPVAESDDVPAATFDDAWPKSERARAADTPPLPPRPTRTPSIFAEAAAIPDRPSPPARAEEQPPVTVLKSGVVDGMAYSLYSDGSIEAQMPEGMMRFASIDELRSHLDQRP